jgi:hypothetical protein
MLNFLVVAVFLLCVTTASANDIGSTDAAEGGHQSEEAEPSFTSSQNDASEAILMAILAVAVFGFQLRRKLRASTRNWQRISGPTEEELPFVALESTPAGEAVSTETPAVTTMRWQQSH